MAHPHYLRPFADYCIQYLSDAQSGTSSRLTDSLLSVIRQQRHLATRVIISTQEPTVVPSKFLDLCSFIIAHRFSSPKWLRLLANHVSAADDCFDELFAKVGPHRSLPTPTADHATLADRLAAHRPGRPLRRQRPRRARQRRRARLRGLGLGRRRVGGGRRGRADRAGLPARPVAPARDARRRALYPRGAGPGAQHALWDACARGRRARRRRDAGWERTWGRGRVGVAGWECFWQRG